MAMRTSCFALAGATSRMFTPVRMYGAWVTSLTRRAERHLCQTAPQRFQPSVVLAKQQQDSHGNEYIRLDGFLKVQGIAETGGQAKVMIQDGMVTVNGEIETRRGRKLLHGDTVLMEGDEESLRVEFE